MVSGSNVIFLKVIIYIIPIVPLSELSVLRKLTYDGDDLVLGYALKHLETLPPPNASRITQISFLVDKPPKRLWEPLDNVLTDKRYSSLRKVEVWDESNFIHLPKLHALGVLSVHSPSKGLSDP